LVEREESDLRWWTKIREPGKAILSFGKGGPLSEKEEKGPGVDHPLAEKKEKMAAVSETKCRPALGEGRKDGPRLGVCVKEETLA